MTKMEKNMVLVAIVNTLDDEDIKEILGEDTEITREEILNALAHEKELLDNKKESKANSKEEKEKLTIRATVLEVLKECTAEDGLRLKDITPLVNAKLESDYTSNKVEPQVRYLKNEGTVIRTEIKRNAYFKLANVE